MRIRNQIALIAGITAAGAAISRDARRSKRLDFNGRSVVITGGSRGLGLLVARQLAEEGARLTIAARDPDELRIARAELEAYGAEVEAVVCDVSVPSDARHLIDRVVDRTGDDGQLVIGWPARLAVLLQAIAPAVVARGAVLADRFVLPAPEERASTEIYSGWQSISRAVPSHLTRLTNRAALQNNEVP